MVEIRGKYNNAKVFTNSADSTTLSQIKLLCDQVQYEGQKIRIMPDCHAGRGCTIGTTITISDKVIPYTVGTDIGCGMLVCEIDSRCVDLQRLDKLIHKYVPHGSGVNNKLHRWATKINLESLKCWNFVRGTSRRDIRLAIGSLGQNNHFIELDKDNDDNICLVIHTGSRNLGLQIAKYYQQAAYDDIHSKHPEVPFELAYCEGQLFEDYIHDMKIAQAFATLNREAISDIVQCGMRWKIKDQWETRHNYIDTDNMILRKGSISAQKGEIAIIPMNMRDGSLIVEGKGNEDWNYSAPHGAGRLMSRTAAKETIPMQDYKDAMEGIYTTCISSGTKDEAPQAYKPMDEIIANVGPTCSIVKTVKPIYNFKAS